MLINVYEDSKSVSFQTDFKTNMILPKYATIKLTNALISLSHKFVVPDNTTFQFVVNDKNGTPLELTIPPATYTLQEFVDEFNAGAKQIIEINSEECEITLTYDKTKGYGAGALTLNLKCLSLLVNKTFLFEFGTSNWSTITARKDDTKVGTINYSANYNSPTTTNRFQITSLEDTTTADLESWAYIVRNAPIMKFWRKPSDTGDSISPPSIHSGAGSTDPYGCMSFQIGQNASKNWWVGLSTGNPDFSGGIGWADVFEDITKYTDVPILMLVVRATTTDGNGKIYTKGEVLIYENDLTNGLQEIGKIDASVSLGSASVIGVSLEEDKASGYFYKLNANTDWEEIEVNATAPNTRYLPKESQNLRWTYSQYGGEPDVANPCLRNVAGTFEADDLDKDDMGKFIDFNFDGFETDLGFDQASYRADTTGDATPTLAVLNPPASNTKDINVNGLVSGVKKSPYVNVNIDNLPITSYGVNSTQEPKDLGLTKTIACIPRYDYAGDFEDNYNLVYNPVEANVIRLNNAEEITLSQLRFRLQHADGSYPLDIEAPISFVLDVQSEERNHFKM